MHKNKRSHMRVWRKVESECQNPDCSAKFLHNVVNGDPANLLCPACYHDWKNLKVLTSLNEEE